MKLAMLLALTFCSAAFPIKPTALVCEVVNPAVPPDSFLTISIDLVRGNATGSYRVTLWLDVDLQSDSLEQAQWDGIGNVQSRGFVEADLELRSVATGEVAGKISLAEPESIKLDFGTLLLGTSLYRLRNCGFGPS